MSYVMPTVLIITIVTGPLQMVTVSSFCRQGCPIGIPKHPEISGGLGSRVRVKVLGSVNYNHNPKHIYNTNPTLTLILTLTLNLP